MFLTHGTTEKNADQIYQSGHFEKRTYFLSMNPDRKLAIFGAAGFGLRNHYKTNDFINLYCSHDLIMNLFKKKLIKESKMWLEKRKKDMSPGLVFVIDYEEHYFFCYKGIKGNLQQFFAPIERYSVDNIPITSISCILTLKENVKYFREKYNVHNVKVKPLEDIEPDPFLKRFINTFYSRWKRFILRQK